MRILKQLYRLIVVLPRLQERAEEKVDEILADLDLLWNEIFGIKYSTLNPFDQIVLFFDAVSRREDKGDIAEAVRLCDEAEIRADFLNDLHVINAHMNNAGRDMNGMNHTVPGQRVTAADVYIGGKYGLFTRTVAEWKSLAGDPKHSEHYKLAQKIAKEYLESHVPLMEAIERLTRNSQAQAAA
jgi:hypothetical protein